MNDTVKHWVDIVLPVITLLATIATPLITFITSVLGAIWYSIRLYEWWKGRKNVNIRDDELEP